MRTFSRVTWKSSARFPIARRQLGAFGSILEWMPRELKISREVDRACRDERIPAGLFRGLSKPPACRGSRKSLKIYEHVLGLETRPERKLTDEPHLRSGQESSTRLAYGNDSLAAGSTGKTVFFAHLAFEVAFDDLQTAIHRIKQTDRTEKFFRHVTDEPSVFGWIRAASDLLQRR